MSISNTVYFATLWWKTPILSSILVSNNKLSIDTMQQKNVKWQNSSEVSLHFLFTIHQKKYLLISRNVHVYNFSTMYCNLYNIYGLLSEFNWLILLLSYCQYLVLAEYDRLGLFRRRECALEGGLRCRRCRSVTVALRDEPTTHDALQVRCEAASNSENELLERQLCGLPHSAVVVLWEMENIRYIKDEQTEMDTLPCIKAKVKPIFSDTHQLQFFTCYTTAPLYNVIIIFNTVLRQKEIF